ncbi:MAG TPA: globin family protein [Polyangiaceae bacterium]|nr:globin family protein [Polyangiaceae bacterium]
MLSRTEKNLVQTTWALVEGSPDEVAALFYGRLFELDPNLRGLFSTDLKEQGRKLMVMIGVAVRALDNLEVLVPRVEQLGQRHASYGVKAEHYATVAAALLWTLEKGLGDRFTSEVRNAWVSVYTILATTMQKGAGTQSHAGPDVTMRSA